MNLGALLSFVGGKIAPFKMYIYLALAAVAASAWFWHGHVKYEQGKADCVETQAKAQARYEKERREAQEKKAQEVIKQTAQVTSKIKDIQHEAEASSHKIEDSARAANRPSSCDLTDDEFMQINDAVRKANAGENSNP